MNTSTYQEARENEITRVLEVYEVRRLTFYLLFKNYLMNRSRCEIDFKSLEDVLLVL